MRVLITVIAAFFLFSVSVYSQSPQSADEIMTAAFRTASKENKKVFIIFHASWCGWCHKMDSSMNDATCKKFFDDNFVVRHLDVDEYKEQNKVLQNPGADAWRTKYHGDSVGIPFWLVFDKDGKLLADSKLRPDGALSDLSGDNVGCPAEEKEVDYFLKVLQLTTAISAQQEAAIRKRFRQNAQ